MLVAGLCALAVVPCYLWAPTLRGALHHPPIEDSLSTLDPALRAVTGWKVVLPALLAGFGLAIPGVVILRRESREAGARATAVLAFATAALGCLGTMVIGVLMLGLLFVVLVVAA